MVREGFDGKVFTTKIPVCVKTAESQVIMDQL